MMLGVIAACAISSPIVTPLSGEAWEFSRPGGAWSQVRVPHDWAIAGPFNPAEKGWQGKLPWRGEGRYRRVFDLTDGQKALLASGGRAYLDFDGVMASPRVRLNGMDLGGVEYGYMSFTLDATAAVRGSTNLLEVACSTLPRRPAQGRSEEARAARDDADIYRGRSGWAACQSVGSLRVVDGRGESLSA